MKKALISGVTGQDGSYLAELLLSKGYEVHGLVRRSSSLNLSRLEPVLSDRARGRGLVLHYGDLANSQQINNILHHARPQEVYHLGAQSHVQVSFDMPEYTGDVTGLGATRLLEAIRCSGQKARFYQASSSEMFGAVPAPQNEKSPFLPQSPYAAAKAYAFWMTADYRAAYGLHASNGILFNHESPRRGEAFVTRKISRAVAAIKAGRQKTLFLGNLQARRDWGYAPEYVEAMWLMVQKSKPGDYVVGTGETHTVGEFCREAFGYAGLNWKKYVKTDARLLRPLEADHLRADASKARRELGWKPRIRFGDLVRVMVDADFKAAGLTPPGEGQAALARAFGRRAWFKD